MNTKEKDAITTADNIADKRQNRQVDWEQRRYEIAKDMLCTIYIDDGNEQRSSDPSLGFEYKSLQGSAREALRYADALIEELKKQG